MVVSQGGEVILVHFSSLVEVVVSQGGEVIFAHFSSFQSDSKQHNHSDFVFS